MRDLNGEFMRDKPPPRWTSTGRNRAGALLHLYLSQRLFPRRTLTRMGSAACNLCFGRSLGASLFLLPHLALIFLLAFPCQAGEESEPAELRISGYGFFGNRQLRTTLELLDADEGRPSVLEANYIEDSAMLLLSRLHRDGYLAARVIAHATLVDNSTTTFSWEGQMEEPLPRPLQVRSVHFEIDKGVLYHYRALEFEGLKAVPEAEARAFFIEADSILPLRSTRIYTPELLRSSTANLREVLERRGYQDAQITPHILHRNDDTGQMHIRVEVVEGKQYFARSYGIEIVREGAEEPERLETAHPQEPFSQLWLQDLAQELRRNYFRKGYPDATVQATQTGREELEETVLLDFLVRVETGPQITVGGIIFEGHEKTRPRVLRRRVPLEPGDLLNRLEAEQGRYRLARLGIFQAVELDYTDVDEQTRNLIYRLREGKEIDISLLFGYGSYELLRVGIDLEQYNVFGRAHHSRLRAIQSFRSSRLEYLYTMPEIFGRDVDVFLNASALRREEVNFTRQEIAGGIGARRFVQALASDVSVRYNYQVLTATQTAVDPRDGLREAAVGSVITEIRHDQRDNPLYPREGYKIFTNIEIGSEFLLGDVNYHRLDFSGSYHWELGRGRWIHLGLSHGVVFTVGEVGQNLPFTRRFFPGGENSIRGFQQGEASPRNEAGQIVGAETFTGSNFEFEQALTPSWSVVGFFDAMGFARRLGNYPMDEILFSAGAGIRWKTLIGPVRLEYGHNLNPRAADPAGTLHFSIGFPF
jgi:outer membrane protein insertion porin family